MQWSKLSRQQPLVTPRRYGCGCKRKSLHAKNSCTYTKTQQALLGNAPSERLDFAYIQIDTLTKSSSTPWRRSTSWRWYTLAANYPCMLWNEVAASRLPARNHERLSARSKTALRQIIVKGFHSQWGHIYLYIYIYIYIHTHRTGESLGPWDLGMYKGHGILYFWAGPLEIWECLWAWPCLVRLVWFGLVSLV